jgi:hypothetical protein
MPRMPSMWRLETTTSSRSCRTVSRFFTICWRLRSGREVALGSGEKLAS